MSQWSPVKPGLQTQVRVLGSGLQELSTVPAALHSQSEEEREKKTYKWWIGQNITSLLFYIVYTLYVKINSVIILIKMLNYWHTALTFNSKL